MLHPLAQAVKKKAALLGSCYESKKNVLTDFPINV
jgi:hypothetical protein